ncbi:hypothetical protein [Rathayibacter sp. VKM Ac-2754]|uniref:hypothetical protein n=1 Tax=Rathayibacter sp. VKM Ac-2754 TaxID=2609251 RepID=UPI00135B1F61|nr:hypothetical protein [Rathayibacter sp. VKM Ac-2754]MWV60867.1 hypothetical protein [Rathayibacter sp. VKM Ac-2754]
MVIRPRRKAAHEHSDDRGARSWAARLFRRPSFEPEPVLPAPVVRPPQTREQIIAQYTSIVQGIVDDDPSQPPLTVSVCGVGPMTINVDGEGRVFLTPRASMN